MANYLPFNSILDGEGNPDRAVKAEDWAWYFSTFIGNGVFPNPSDGLQVFADTGMSVYVADGFGFINGYAFRNPSDYSVTIPTADGSLGRIDRIVLRWSLTNRLIEIALLTGTVAATPVAPELTRNSDTYELALADISVGAGVTQITQSMITDRRGDDDICGIVVGLVDQIDWETLVAQLNAFMTEYSARIVSDYADYTNQIETFESEFENSANTWLGGQQAAFEAWVETIRDILDEAAAGHLQNEIDEINQNLAIDEDYDYETFGTVKDFMDMITLNDYWAPIADENEVFIVDDDGYYIAGNWSYEVA
jgi:hypothetical protein